MKEVKYGCQLAPNLIQIGHVFIVYAWQGVQKKGESGNLITSMDQDDNEAPRELQVLSVTNTEEAPSASVNASVENPPAVNVLDECMTETLARVRLRESVHGQNQGLFPVPHPTPGQSPIPPPPLIQNID